MYKLRSEVKRLPRRLNRYCCVSYCFEKLGVMFVGLVNFALMPTGFACIEGI